MGDNERSNIAILTTHTQAKYYHTSFSYQKCKKTIILEYKLSLAILKTTYFALSFSHVIADYRKLPNLTMKQGVKLLQWPKQEIKLLLSNKRF